MKDFWMMMNQTGMMGRFKKMNNVEILLSKLDKGKLSDFIRKECINDSRFQDRFLALGAGFFKPAPNSYTSAQ